MLSDAQIGAFHPALVHFPIVLVWVALVCDVLCLFGKRPAGILGAWIILAAALMAIPTVITGLEASEYYSADDPAVYRHWRLALVTASALWLYALVRGYNLFRQRFWHPSIYAAAGLLLAGGVSLTADAGGVVTRGYSPFQLRSHEHIHGEAKETCISLTQVQRVFVDNHCAKCHANVFDPDGYPRNVSNHVAIVGNQMGTMLPRHPDGSLDTPEKSPFYRSLITQNAMPMRQNGAPGLTEAERLIVLEWLIEGAPISQRSSYNPLLLSIILKSISG